MRKPFLVCWKRRTPWFTNFEFEKFFSLFYIMSTQRRYIYQKLDTNSCFAKLRTNSYLFSFFLYTLYYFTLYLLPDNFTHQGNAGAQCVNQTICPCVYNRVALWPNVSYFIILLCLLADDFIHQGESSPWVKQAKYTKL